MHSKKNHINNSSVLQLHGVGPQLAKHLARLNIHTIQDVLFHLPMRYQDRTQVQLIRQIKPDEDVVVEGTITTISKPTRGKTKLLCELRDETAKLSLRFFHLMTFKSDALREGSRLRCYGTVRVGQKGLEITHPEFHQIVDGKSVEIDKHLTPFYPATEGLSQYALRKITSSALACIERGLICEELLPEALLKTFNFPVLSEALQFIHRPPQEASIDSLMENKTVQQKRLIFEELLAHRLSLLRIKHEFQAQKSFLLSPKEKLSQALLQSLPFNLTSAQKRVMHEVNADLTQAKPMLRLVQGDVGSGKTIIAALAALQAIENHYQVALMAPTELLAEQHHRVFKKWLEPLGINIVFLSGNIKGRARTDALANIESGNAQLILGTHALFQDGVKFKNLALVIVDEQHRFGVHQRALFRDKGKQQDLHPHQLVMTATPIPRTLAMSFYADLDISVIDELPPGRTPIVTTVIANSRRDEIVNRIREACEQGRQVYWVCPLIEESEILNCQAATDAAEMLNQLLPHLRIGLVHGRMTAAEKDAAMQAFQQGNTHILVATTVIEVGVDVPNASVMIIENAERLGLSQLHQLRGRVGRGSIASYCVLLYQHPLSELAKTRLAVMRDSNDGFVIAQRDLELRGPGEVMGVRQAGELSFRMADLLRDKDLLTSVQEAAELILRNHVETIPLLVKRWLRNSDQYAQV